MLLRAEVLDGRLEYGAHEDTADTVHVMDAAALWISFAAAAAGLASAVIAWFARGDALKAQEEATSAQKEALRAESRSAIAAERIAQIQGAIFDGPPWTVSWFAGDTYLLTNNSPMDACDVVIDGQPDEVVLQVSDTSPRTVGARSAFKFVFTGHLGIGIERDVVVRWRRPTSDEELTWRHPIPQKPKNG